MKLYIKNNYNSKNENSEALAKKVLALYMNEKETSASFDAEDFLIERTLKGKPYLAKVPATNENSVGLDSIHFSISHTDDLWACIVSENNLGLDIQCAKERTNMEAVAKRFFGEDEQKYVEEAFSRGQREGETAFYRVWTGREAYAKYTGEGFFGESLKKFSVVKVSNIKCFVLNDLLTCETVKDGKARALYCSICIEEDEDTAREVEIVEL